jgi:hypothetical protein
MTLAFTRAPLEPRDLDGLCERIGSAVAGFDAPTALAREARIERRRALRLRAALRWLTHLARLLILGLAERLRSSVTIDPSVRASAKADDRTRAPRPPDVSDPDSARWTGVVFRCVLAARRFDPGLRDRLGPRRRPPSSLPSLPLALALEALRRVARAPERYARRLARRLAANRRRRARRVRAWRRGYLTPRPRGRPRVRIRWLDTS